MAARKRVSRGEQEEDDGVVQILRILHDAVAARQALVDQLNGGIQCLYAIDGVFRQLSTTHDVLASDMSSIVAEYMMIQEARKRLRSRYVPIATAPCPVRARMSFFAAHVTVSRLAPSSSCPPLTVHLCSACGAWR